MALQIIGISLLVAFAMLFVSVGVWYVSVPLTALTGNPHSAETLGCVRYTFLGVFIASYILSFCWQVYQAMQAGQAE